MDPSIPIRKLSTEEACELIEVYRECSLSRLLSCVKLIRILLTWRIWWAPNNASKWQRGFNSSFKWLKIDFKKGMNWRKKGNASKTTLVEVGRSLRNMNLLYPHKRSMLPPPPNAGEKQFHFQMFWQFPEKRALRDNKKLRKCQQQDYLTFR